MLHGLKDSQNKNCTPSTSTINWLCKKISTFVREEIFFLPYWPIISLMYMCSADLYINNFILTIYILYIKYTLI